MRGKYAMIAIAAAALLVSAPLRADTAYEESLGALLPQSGEIGEWSRDGEQLIYYADDLWEYINGAAEGFLAYEVKAVIAQDYVDRSGAGIKLEIYDHQTPLMGFGIYAQHRDPSLAFVEIGREGFADEYSVQFWKGRYYVKLIAYSATGEIAAAMRLVAGAVAGKIADDSEPPEELDLFPQKGLVPRSEALLTEGVLGRSRFPRAFVGSYDLDGASGKLYLFRRESAEDAAELLAWYAGEIGLAIEARESGGLSYLYGEGTDPYQGEVAMFGEGSWVGVLTGFEGAPDARAEVAAAAVGRIAAPKPPTPSPLRINPAPR